MAAKRSERKSRSPQIQTTGGHTTIRAAVMRRRAKPFKIETVFLDAPRPDEVLVRIVAAGVCHTDMAVRDDRGDSPIPSILGHEGAGVVERIGAGVRKVACGDHVVLSFMSCGRCRLCQRGEPSYCEKLMALNFGCAREDGSVSARGRGGAIQNHFFGQSSFATHAIANERNVVKVPKNVKLELLGPLGCGLQTGAGAVMNSLKVKAGESFAVFGSGSVGLAAVMAARAVGATTIIAVDVVDARLRLAKRIGATHAIDARRQNPVAAIMKITGGRGLDYTLDTTGIAAVFGQAVDTLGIRGLMGYVTGGARPARKLDARAFMAKGKRLMGILEGDAVPDVFIPYLLKLHTQGRFPFEKMVKFYPLSRINQAFADSHHGRTIKPIIRMG